MLEFSDVSAGERSEIVLHSFAMGGLDGVSTACGIGAYGEVFEAGGCFAG